MNGMKKLEQKKENWFQVIGLKPEIFINPQTKEVFEWNNGKKKMWTHKNAVRTINDVDYFCIQSSKFSVKKQVQKEKFIEYLIGNEPNYELDCFLFPENYQFIGFDYNHQLKEINYKDLTSWFSLESLTAIERKETYIPFFEESYPQVIRLYKLRATLDRHDPKHVRTIKDVALFDSDTRELYVNMVYSDKPEPPYPITKENFLNAYVNDRLCDRAYYTKTQIKQIEETFYFLKSWQYWFKEKERPYHVKKYVLNVSHETREIVSDCSAFQTKLEEVTNGIYTLNQEKEVIAKARPNKVIKGSPRSTSIKYTFTINGQKVNLTRNFQECPLYIRTRILEKAKEKELNKQQIQAFLAKEKELNEQQIQEENKQPAQTFSYQELPKEVLNAINESEKPLNVQQANERFNQLLQDRIQACIQNNPIKLKPVTISELMLGSRKKVAKESKKNQQKPSNNEKPKLTDFYSKRSVREGHPRILASKANQLNVFGNIEPLTYVDWLLEETHDSEELLEHVCHIPMKELTFDGYNQLKEEVKKCIFCVDKNGYLCSPKVENNDKKPLKIFCDIETAGVNRGELEKRFSKPSNLQTIITHVSFGVATPLKTFLAFPIQETAVLSVPNFHSFFTLLSDITKGETLHIEMLFHNGAKYDNHFLLAECRHYAEVTDKPMSRNTEPPTDYELRTKPKEKGVNYLTVSYVKSRTNLDIAGRISNINFISTDTLPKTALPLGKIGKRLNETPYHSRNNVDGNPYPFRPYADGRTIAVVPNEMRKDFQAYQYTYYDQKEPIYGFKKQLAFGVQCFKETPFEHWTYILNDILLESRLTTNFDDLFQGFDFDCRTKTQNALNKFTEGNALATFQLLGITKVKLPQKGQKPFEAKRQFSDYGFTDGENLFQFIKRGYKGGICRYNSRYVGQELLFPMFSMDLHSSYPSVIARFGIPTYIYQVYDQPKEHFSFKPSSECYQLVEVSKETFNRFMAHLNSNVLKDSYVNMYQNINSDTVVISNVFFESMLETGFNNEKLLDELPTLRELAVEALGVFPIVKGIAFEYETFGNMARLMEYYKIKEEGKSKYKMLDTLEKPFDGRDVIETNELNTHKPSESYYMAVKQLLNAIYGAPGIKDYYPRMFFNQETGEWETLAQGNKNTERNIIFSCYIADRARAQLLRPLGTFLDGAEIDRLFVYGDTDSLYLRHEALRYFRRHQLKTGENFFHAHNMGTWAIEHEFIVRFFVQTLKKYTYVSYEKEIGVISATKECNVWNEKGGYQLTGGADIPFYRIGSTIYGFTMERISDLSKFNPNDLEFNIRCGGVNHGEINARIDEKIEQHNRENPESWFENTPENRFHLLVNYYFKDTPQQEPMTQKANIYTKEQTIAIYPRETVFTPPSPRPLELYAADPNTKERAYRLVNEFLKQATDEEIEAFYDNSLFLDFEGNDLRWVDVEQIFSERVYPEQKNILLCMKKETSIRTLLPIYQEQLKSS